MVRAGIFPIRGTVWRSPGDTYSRIKVTDRFADLYRTFLLSQAPSLAAGTIMALTILNSRALCLPYHGASYSISAQNVVIARARLSSAPMVERLISTECGSVQPQLCQQGSAALCAK